MEMEYYKRVTLKDGRECVLRNGGEGDGEIALEIFRLTHEQSDFLLTYPDEITFTVEQEESYLREKAASDREAEILAFVDGKLAGTAGIESLGKHYKLKHRADFGISVDKAYWGLGIGRALTNASIECAKRAGYAQLELQAVADNEAALSLYKSVGFAEYGRNPRGFRSRVTGWQELVLMRLELDEQETEGE